MYEKLDRKTLEYISDELARLQVKNFELYCGKEGKYKFTDHGKGKDEAYRDVARILSDAIEHEKEIERGYETRG